MWVQEAPYHIIAVARMEIISVHKVYHKKHMAVVHEKNNQSGQLLSIIDM